jgi:hypothetical protein
MAMRKSLILWLFVGLILCLGNLQAADVEFNVESITALSSQDFLGAPRPMMIPRNVPGGVIGYSGKGLIRFTGYGQTIDAGPTATLNDYNHNHVLYRNDTVWICHNNDGAFTNITVTLNNVAATPMARLHTATLDYGTYDHYISSISFFDADYPDSMILITRGAGGEYAKNISYALSGDRGQTWVWQGYAVNLSSGDCRIGLRQIGDSAVMVYWRPQGGGNIFGAYYCYAYSANHGWSAVGSQPISGASQIYTRDYTFLGGKGGIVHVLASDTATPGRVHDFWKRTTDANFADYVVYTSDKKELNAYSANNRGMQVAACLSVIDSSLRFYLTSSYGQALTSNRRAYWIRWNNTTNTVGSATQISSPTGTIWELTGSYDVPASHEISSYVGIVNGDGYLATIKNDSLSIEANAQVLITSLPIKIINTMHSAAYLGGTKDRDTIAIQGVKLTSLDSGIVIENTDDWTIIGQNDTVVFAAVDASVSATAHEGINLRNSDSIIIEYLNIIEGTTGIDTTQYLASDAGSHDNTGLYIGGGSLFPIIRNSYIEVSSYNSHAIEAWNCPGFYAVDCNIKSKVWAYDSRCQFDGAAVFLTHQTTAARIAAGADYHVNFERVNILRTPHVGIIADPTDSGVFQTYDCNVFIDAENWRYTAYNGTCCGKANCYGIQFTNADDGSYIKKCTVLAGDQNTGGRGLQLVGCNGLELGDWVNPIVMCSNYVNVHENGDIEFYDTNLVSQQEYFPCAVKVRQENYGVDIFDNEFIYTADGQASWSPFGGNSYYPRGEAGMYQLWDGGTDPTPCDVRWHNNLFRTTDRTSGAFNAAFVFENIDYLDHTLLFYNNRLETDSVFIRLGGRDTDFGVLVDTVTACTLKSLDPNNKVTGYIHGWRALDGGYFNAQTTGFTTKDMYYLSYANDPIAVDTSIYFPSISREQDQKNLLTIDITVVDSLDNPIQGANVLLTNGYFTVLYDGLTNAQGKVTKIAPVWYESRTLPDLFGYNDHQITASYAGLQADSTKTFTFYDKSIIVRLGTAAQPIVRKHFHGIHK